MKNFVSNLEKEEIKEQMLHKSRGPLNRKYTTSISQEGNLRKPRNDLSRYQIKPTDDLKKFEAIYIPNISSDQRRSEITYN
jgi:hypothetical protein